MPRFACKVLCLPQVRIFIETHHVTLKQFDWLQDIPSQWAENFLENREKLNLSQFTENLPERKGDK